MIHIVIFTSICRNYLPRARVLANSIKKNMPSAKVYVCLCEREIFEGDYYATFDNVVLAKDIGFQDFETFIMKHTVVEASTAVKGQMLKWLMEKNEKEPYFVYLDPDIKVYSNFAELPDLLDKYPVVVCPHLLRPGNIEMELSACKHGTFNLGFLGVSNVSEGREFVSWWASRLALFCFDDIPRGVFTDQKWINLAPCFFNTYILKHEGYDYATWSLQVPVEEHNGNLYVGNDPLRFIHFSSALSGLIPKLIKNWQCQNVDVFLKNHKAYVEELYVCGQKEYGAIEWTYRKNAEGKVITDKDRIKNRQKGASNNLFLRTVSYVRENGWYALAQKLYSKILN